MYTHIHVNVEGERREGSGEKRESERGETERTQHRKLVNSCG